MKWYLQGNRNRTQIEKNVVYYLKREKKETDILFELEVIFISN